MYDHGFIEDVKHQTWVTQPKLVTPNHWFPLKETSLVDFGTPNF